MRTTAGRGTANRSRNGLGVGLGVLVLGAIVVAVAPVPTMRADDAGQGAAGGGAARLSSVEGQVRLLQGGQIIADPAVVNAPLFAGTEIQTGDDGKAEIQFDDGSVARLSPDSGMTLSSVGAQGGADILLEGGLGYFELQGGGQDGGPGGGQMRVTFGDSVATASGFTVMRVKMDNPPGELAVFSGNAHLERGSAMAIDLHGGESVSLSASDPTQYNLAETIEPDSWDAWNSDRDQALNAQAADQTGAANNFVNSQAPNPEWNDLDANGNWYNVPGEGYIWSPYDASNAGWDPYGNGNWMYTPGYGYIFVSGYSWGFTPYQCGMWNFYNGFGWGWSPGMGGCHPWWGGGGGGYRGVNIGRTPPGYRTVTMPRAPGNFGRTPPKVISVNRGFDGKMGGVPVRRLNDPVSINGKTVMPMRPMPVHQTYRPTQSGFVYRPSGGYKGTNTGSGYVYNPGPASGAGSGPASNVHVSPGHRQSYSPPAAPRYTLIQPPPPQPPSTETPGGNNAAPGGNNGAPGGKPGMGGLVPRDYNRNRGNGNNGNNDGGRTFTRPSEPAPQPTFRQPQPAPRNVGNPSSGGSFSRPAPTHTGGQPGARPSGGGGGSFHPSGGGGGGGAPRGGGGGGGAPHGGGGGGGPHR